MENRVEDELRQRRPDAPLPVPPQPPLAPSAPLVHDYGSGSAYAEAVRTWLWAYQSWSMAQALVPLQLHSAILASAAAAQASSAAAAQSGAAAQPRPAQATPQTPPRGQARPAGPATETTCVAASFGRRLLAELMDFCFCFLLKLAILYFLVEAEVIQVEKYGKLLGEQADLATFLDVTTDLFPIEILNKFLTSMLEALVVWNGWVAIPAGFTPGKFLAGIKVVRCDGVEPFAARDHRVRVRNVRPLSLSVSIGRSMVKNACLSFLFPLSVLLYAFKFNRSLYDIATGTLVIEAQA